MKLKRLRLETRGDVMFLLILSGITVLIIGIQQLFPSHGYVPFAMVNGRLTRISSADSITKPYKLAEDKKITLRVAGKTYSYRTGDLGVTLNVDASLKPYRVESRLKRLIPFSMLAQTFRKQSGVYASSQKGLNIITAAIADEVNIEPHDAQIIIDQDHATIEASIDGVNFDPSRAALAIFDAISRQKESLSLDTKVTEADITTAELEKAVADTTTSLPDSLVIQVDKKETTLTKQIMISWLSYTPKDSQPVVGFDTTKVQAYADGIAAEYSSAQAPTATIVSLTDGKETGRIPGRAGKAIIGTTLNTQITTALANKTASVQAQLVDVPSPIKYSRSYTRSSAGLQDMLNEITEGKEISIEYMDINERGWNVGSKQRTFSSMASTYKMFVAYSVLKRIDAGSIRFSDRVNGYSYDECITKMIVESNNECSIAMAEKIGWGTVVNEGKALGAADLNWTNNAWGSVHDCVVLLSKLARGEILSQGSRDYFIGLMKRQNFRQGIPAGVGVEVADKVGFLDGQLNDAAIVYAPDLTHVLVIYTNHQSWATIAEITRQIESLAL